MPPSSAQLRAWGWSEERIAAAYEEDRLCKLPLPLRRGAFSSPEQICFRIRDLPGPPGQPTCADESQRFLSCRNIGLRSARDGLKSCFDRTLSGKSLAEPYRISIERFTARVPEMPKYSRRWI